jgi:hypothetical protein
MNTFLKFAALLSLLSCSSISFGQVIEFEDSPLDDITHEMKVSASQLSKKVTAKPAQDPQRKSVEKLDALIAKLEEERKKLQGSGQSVANPTIPANASNIMSGPGGSGDLQSVRDADDRWGDLPAHERDRILQSLTEGFPPHYQAILEAYYKRLATEKPVDDGELAPPRTAKPPAKMKPPMPKSKK